MLGFWTLLGGGETLACSIIKENPGREAGAGAPTVPPSLALSPPAPRGSSGLSPLLLQGDPWGGVSGLSRIGGCGRRPGWLASRLRGPRWVTGPSSLLGRAGAAGSGAARGRLRRGPGSSAAARGPGVCQGPRASPARRLRPWAVQVGVCEAARLAVLWSRERKAELIKSTANSAGYPQK